jgi:hypothetical protein
MGVPEFNGIYLALIVVGSIAFGMALAFGVLLLKKKLKEKRGMTTSSGLLPLHVHYHHSPNPIELRHVSIQRRPNELTSVMRVYDGEHRDGNGRLTRPTSAADLVDFRPVTGMYAQANLEDQLRLHLDQAGHVIAPHTGPQMLSNTTAARDPPLYGEDSPATPRAPRLRPAVMFRHGSAPDDDILDALALDDQMTLMSAHNESTDTLPRYSPAPSYKSQQSVERAQE